MSDELDILKATAERLDRLEIPYMVTGSMAANFYTEPRMTRDIDIVLVIPLTAVEKFFETFGKDFYLDADSIKEAIKNRSMFNIIHLERPVKVDFIVRKNEVYRKEEFERRQKVKIDGFACWIVSPEDLILSKLDWAKDSLSEMQLSDIKNLLGSVAKLDFKYLEKWIGELKLDKIYSKAKSYERH